MGLDRYGNPAPHIANDIITNMAEYGTEAKRLEEAWFNWLEYNPFDTAVAIRYKQLQEDRISRYDSERDQTLIQEANRKLSLISSRVERYGRLKGIISN